MNEHIKYLIDKLEARQSLERGEFSELLSDRSSEAAGYLFSRAREARRAVYGKDVYIRGLIEFTSYCKNDCLYCGIRRSNGAAERYRLTSGQILECCETGYSLGYRTFVLQGGEDAYYSDKRLAEIVRAIKSAYTDCAVTLSVGERSYESYHLLREAGADRYLLRHETADTAHYAKLHPPEQSLESRIHCLHELKELGYQVGCGFMVGSPYQTDDNIISDLLFIRKFEPHMVGIGPFIPHHATPFAGKPAGTLELTLYLLGIIRLMLPHVLLPATTALGTIDARGRELGLLAGANVVMPNLSPVNVRKKYMLYDGKICTGDEAAECRRCLERRVESIGYKIVTDRGDWRG